MGKQIILIVDDDQLIREMLTEILESEGFSVETAVDGKEGLGKYQKNGGVNIIISDMNMPIMDGQVFLEKIREKSDDVPFIVLTSNDEVALAVSMIHSGADDYLVKDDRIENKIGHAVRKVLERKQRQDEQQRKVQEFSRANTPSGDYTELVQTIISAEVRALGKEKVMRVLNGTHIEINPDKMLVVNEHSFSSLEKLMDSLVAELGPICIMYCRIKSQELAYERDLVLPECLQA